VENLEADQVSRTATLPRASFAQMTMYGSLTASVGQSTGVSNPTLFESRAQREIKRAQKFKRILAEKIKLQSRLDSVQLQSAAILTQYKARKAANGST
jgi:hypothetical protein